MNIFEDCFLFDEWIFHRRRRRRRRDIGLLMRRHWLSSSGIANEHMGLALITGMLRVNPYALSFKLLPSRRVGTS